MQNKFLRALKWMGGTISYYAAGLYDRLDSHHAFLMAGGLAFSIFICTIPLNLIAFSVLGALVEQPDIAEKIRGFIDQAIPYPQYADRVKDIIAGGLRDFSALKEISGIAGVIGLFIAGSSLFSSVRTVLNTVFRPSKAESIVVGKLWDFALVFIMLIFFLVVIIALPLLEAFSWLDLGGILLGTVGLQFAFDLALAVIMVVAVFSAFFIVYWLIPVRRPSFRVISVSAVSGSLLWLAAKEGFGYYITSVASWKHVYGVYAFLIVVAFWLYYSALVFIISAEIGRLHGERVNGSIE